jgi:hypothetical protein
VEVHRVEVHRVEVQVVVGVQAVEEDNKREAKLPFSIV